MISKKNKTTKKIILTVFLLIFFCFSGTPKTQAAWIPGLDPAIDTGLKLITNLIDGLMTGTLKQQAVMTLSAQVDSLAGRGSGGQASFIVNWESFLVDQPENDARLYMNDYISRMTGGRNSYSGYSTEGFTGPANHSANMAQMAQVLSAAKTPQVTYEGDPSQMFDSGNFKNMELYLSGVNNAWSFNMAVEAEKQKVIANKRFVAATKGNAGGGYLGVPGDSPGTETMPGSTVGAMMNSKQTMPDRLLEAASSIPEVATALVTQMISRSVTQGFVSVQRSASKTAASINKFNAAKNSAINTYGPAVESAKQAPKVIGDIVL